MSLKENSIDSISLGLEDYKNASVDSKRILSATRNLYSGIVLLFKYKIGLLEPTRNLQQLNLKPIKNILEKNNIDIDSDELKAIQEFRNDIEHHSSALSSKDRVFLVSNAFIILQNFIENHLKVDPKDFLGESNYQILVKANEVYLEEKKRLLAVTSQQLINHPELIEWIDSSYCQSCRNSLLYSPSNMTPNDLNSQHICCKYCGELSTFYDFFKSKEESTQWAITRGKGNSYPIIPCIYCSNGFINTDTSICYSCSGSISITCSCCGGDLNLYCQIELADGWCSGCNNHYHKFMAD